MQLRLIGILLALFLTLGCKAESPQVQIQPKSEAKKVADTSPIVKVIEPEKPSQPQIPDTSAESIKPAKTDNPKPTSAKLPKMVDYGADSCVPCKAMAPILVELRHDFKGKFDVIFIDVWKDPNPGRAARIRLIPTQIFYDADGRELFRHEGFYSRENILSKWRDLGYNFN